MNNFLPLMVAIPLGSAILILLITKIWKGFGDLAAFLTTGFTTVAAFMILTAPDSVYYMGRWLPPFGICLVKDSLTAMMLLVVNVIGFLAVVFSFSYMKKFTSKPKYYCLFMLMIAGMNGVALTGDLFNLFVYLEVASIASYALVGFGVGDTELEASFKYIILGALASSLILLGVGVLYSVTGSLNMADIGRILNGAMTNNAILFAAGFFIVGFGLKAGLVPFHAWLPDAHPSAPAPVSAMLSGVLIKVLGVYSLIRVFYSVLGITSYYRTIFIVLGLVSMFVGVFMGIGQKDLKRLLAFCSISQVGLIIVGIGIGTPLAIAGALFHLFNHAVVKSLLFLDSGSIEYTTGTKDLSKLGGLLKKLPVTGSTTAYGSLAMAGVPPFNVFWSKVIIIMAAVQAGHPVIAGLIIVESFMTLAMFIKVQRFALFGDLPAKLAKIKEAPFSMSFVLILLAVISIAAGLFSMNLFDSIFLPAQEIVANKSQYISLLFGM